MDSLVYITKTDLIKQRETLPIEEMREQTRQTKERLGYVDYNGIFETMGFTHSFNQYYMKTADYKRFHNL